MELTLSTWKTARISGFPIKKPIPHLAKELLRRVIPMETDREVMTADSIAAEL